MRGFSFFLGTDAAGHTNCVSVFALNGRLLFCTDPAGYLNRAGGSPCPGGSFFAESQRRVALCGARGFAAPAAGQEGRHQGFYPLNSRFLLGESVRRLPICDRSEIGERQSGYSCVCFVKYSQFTDSVLLHIRATLRKARHDSAAQFFCALYRKAPANLGVWYNLSS